MLQRLMVTSALILALVLSGETRVAAGTGNCAAASNFFSSACYYKDTQFSGAYVEFPSVALNIAQAAANNGEWIGENLILRDRQSSPFLTTFLEVGDSGGGGFIPGHTGEWSRMWYWVDGSSGGYSENFIQYSPADAANRSYGMQWESSQTAWVIYIAGSAKATVTTWRNPTTTADMRQFTGMEINNGGRALDASKNSPLFGNKNQQWRDLTNIWHGWDLVWTQVDSPCGTAPTCLQGWWSGVWNNAKPAQ